MFKMRVLIMFSALFTLWSISNAKPLNQLKLKHKAIPTSNMLRSSFFKYTGKRSSMSTCEEIKSSEQSIKNFTDEVAMAFLNSGDLENLDKLLDYLVETKCFTALETSRFRKQVVHIYNLLHSDEESDDESEVLYERKNEVKRAITDEQYKQLNDLIDILVVGANSGEEKSFELLKFMADYILVLEHEGLLNKKEMHSLLEKIKTVVHIENEHVTDELKQTFKGDSGYDMK